MGVVNVTPDSFSDGGRWHDANHAVDHALSLVDAGVDILDIGGESTRPGAEAVSLQEELDRVLPVIHGIAQKTDIPISIDTTKAQVMRQALEEGASLINDISALERSPEGADILAESAHPVILMHMQGSPGTMQTAPHYDNVVIEVAHYLEQRIQWCEARGIQRHRIVIDPGIGFGKTTRHNLDLINHLDVLRSLSVPVLLGVSRKRIIGELTKVQQADRRDPGSHTMALMGIMNGAGIVRVHDVAGMRQTVDVFHGVYAHSR
ncbi:MAG: dihydropteroate synthase [Magnetococcales bacterium]|nr:dihydropteroate synthase [Magnetococcales bacterium]